MLLQELVRELHELNYLLKQVVHLLHTRTKYKVTGGMIFRLGDPMVPISPGNAPKFQVSPTFSGEAFTLDGAKAAVESSDPANFPVALDLAGDPTGATFVADIPADAQPTGGSEAVTVTWSYTNLDGVVATVTGTVTEVGLTDDVVGGTFTQVA